jgi:hypothetical protein
MGAGVALATEACATVEVTAAATVLESNSSLGEAAARGFSIETGGEEVATALLGDALVTAAGATAAGPGRSPRRIRSPANTTDQLVIAP